MLTLLVMSTVGYSCSEFCSMVRKICIYTTEEARSLSRKMKLTVIKENRPGTTISDADIGIEEQSSNAASGF